MVAAIVGLDARPGTTEYQLARETPPPFAGRVRSQRPQHGSMVVTAHRVSSLLGVLLMSEVRVLHDVAKGENEADDVQHGAEFGGVDILGLVVLEPAHLHDVDLALEGREVRWCPAHDKEFGVLKSAQIPFVLEACAHPSDRNQSDLRRF